MEQWDVVGIGSVSVDIAGAIPFWPQPGTKLKLENLDLCDGGLIGTALVTVSRLGGKACYLGKMGDSEWAIRALEQLSREGVETSLVVHQEDAGPHFAIVLTLQEDGQRTIFYSKAAVQYPDSTQVAGESWLRRTRVFLFDAGSGKAGLSLALEARRAGIPVVIDAEQPVPSLEEMLLAADHLVIPESLAQELDPGWLRALDPRPLRRRREQTVVVTRGGEGCIASGPDGAVLRLPAFTVEVVDTTGCGDVFHGAYALGLARGLDLRSRCRWASAAAALAATRLGGRTGIPTADAVQRLLRGR
ncbi:MAG: PfkB family carbohydrate kinase [Acidobacteriota bacterium]